MMKAGFRHSGDITTDHEIQMDDGSWVQVLKVQRFHGVWVTRLDLEVGPYVALWYDDWVMSR